MELNNGKSRSFNTINATPKHSKPNLAKSLLSWLSGSFTSDPSNFGRKGKASRKLHARDDSMPDRQHGTTLQALNEVDEPEDIFLADAILHHPAPASQKNTSHRHSTMTRTNKRQRQCSCRNVPSEREIIAAVQIMTRSSEQSIAFDDIVIPSTDFYPNRDPIPERLNELKADSNEEDDYKESLESVNEIFFASLIKSSSKADVTQDRSRILRGSRRDYDADESFELRARQIQYPIVQLQLNSATPSLIKKAREIKLLHSASANKSKNLAGDKSYNQYSGSSSSDYTNTSNESYIINTKKIRDSLESANAVRRICIPSTDYQSSTSEADSSASYEEPLNTSLLYIPKPILNRRDARLQERIKIKRGTRKDMPSTGSLFNTSSLYGKQISSPRNQYSKSSYSISLNTNSSATRTDDHSTHGFKSVSGQPITGSLFNNSSFYGLRSGGMKFTVHPVQQDVERDFSVGSLFNNKSFFGRSLADTQRQSRN